MSDSEWSKFGKYLVETWKQRIQKVSQEMLNSFRQKLKEPLIPKCLHAEFNKLAEASTPEERIKLFKEFFQRLPGGCQTAFTELFNLMNSLCSTAQVNANQMAQIIAPYTMWTEEDMKPSADKQTTSVTDKSINVVQFLIENYHKITTK